MSRNYGALGCLLGFGIAVTAVVVAILVRADGRAIDTIANVGVIIWFGSGIVGLLYGRVRR
jgi:hypothetical protein